ncbi:MAG TPA: FKBP-type peptidyl-prolyl cis-trans isomerase [Novosphingobium sp.]|nr:FKBP-type peptidyl-prolyl cis-trans isomerase [Novosphingobium sp.]
MSEVTRVPILPIAKGSLTKLWLGVALALAIGGGLAYAQRTRGVEVETLTAGTGMSPTLEDMVLVNYTGRLSNGTEFDKGERVPIALDAVVPGFAEGIVQMKKGGKYRLTIPADKGYGAEAKRNPQTGQVVIPANSDLVFDVELVDFRNRAEIMQQQQMLQQLQQMQQGAQPGAQAGAPPPPPQ